MSTSLAKFTADLRRLPRVVANKVAAEAAPKITALAQKTFDLGQDAYGVPWVAGYDGSKVDLVESGELRRKTVYVAIGTKLRIALAVDHAKYQLGRRPVFPRQGQTLPLEYTRTLERVAADVVRKELA